MRKFHHWTPRYMWNRLNVMRREFSNPGEPWLTKTANQILSSYLRNSDTGLEFGSGRSTLWFARRVSVLTSIEENPRWYNRVTKMLEDARIYNVTQLLVEKGRNNSAAYVQVCKKFSKNSLDFVLVDGCYRAACATTIIEYIRPGGILIIDDAHRYLPCNSVSPYSRTFALGPASPQWAEFLIAVEQWRCIWTSSGVTDTAIYLKPC
ncbi:MAG: class I SAM-dependent methyltransferase [Desulfobacteraceae bacterium]|nr:class I SAM-dependent methyltransferase [Desulfobacteraceae bacterium]